MIFLKKLFRKKEKPIESYSDFWDWFVQNERSFYEVVRDRGNIEKDFFKKLSPKLDEVCVSLYYVTGMYNDDTVELIITPEGIVKNIVFAEELVASAPAIKGWRFTALKPSLQIADISIEMDGYRFDKDNIYFYPNGFAEYPDEIDLAIVHDDYTEENSAAVINGTYIFLDNYLGELDLVTAVDNISFIRKNAATKELIPVIKLKDYLRWRQAEFIEKYEGVRHNTENDSYASMEAELENGDTLIAVLNTDLLKWDGKASHPWVMIIKIKYDGAGNNGMPDSDSYNLLNRMEEEILAQLEDHEGYLYVGRQTGTSVREIYFSCKDFRKPSKVVKAVLGKYAGKFEGSFDIYKDKYWRSFNRFKPVP